MYYAVMFILYSRIVESVEINKTWLESRWTTVSICNPEISENTNTLLNFKFLNKGKIDQPKITNLGE